MTRGGSEKNGSWLTKKNGMAMNGRYGEDHRQHGVCLCRPHPPTLRDGARDLLLQLQSCSAVAESGASRSLGLALVQPSPRGLGHPASIRGAAGTARASGD